MLLEDESFGGFTKRNAAMVEEALRHLPEGGPARVLDLGCGAGETTFVLAAQRPNAVFEGVDVSSESIERARRRGDAEGVSGRAVFRVADYLGADVGGPFDLVVADQVLHLVPGSTEALARRLAGDVAPGGVLLAEMPYAGRYNAALVGVRRVLRRLRGPTLDRASLRIARRLYGDEFSDEELRERVVYNYVLPERTSSPEWDDLLAAAGLQLEQRRVMPHASPAQLRHHLSIYKKSA